MAQAVIFDCLGVLARHGAIGWRVDQAVLQFAESLQPACKVGLLSNLSSSSMAQIFPESDRANYFDAVVVSSEVGLAKPQPEIYLLTCQRLGCKPEDCIFVDDTASNCAAAETAGMRSVLYHDVATLRRDVAALLPQHEK